MSLRNSFSDASLLLYNSIASRASYFLMKQWQNILPETVPFLLLKRSLLQASASSYPFQNSGKNTSWSLAQMLHILSQHIRLDIFSAGVSSAWSPVFHHMLFHHCSKCGYFFFSHPLRITGSWQLFHTDHNDQYFLFLTSPKICLGEIFSEVQRQYTAESISHQNIVDTTSMLFQKRKLIEYSCSPKSAPQYRNRSFVTRKLLFL